MLGLLEVAGKCLLANAAGKLLVLRPVDSPQVTQQGRPALEQLSRAVRALNGRLVQVGGFLIRFHRVGLF